MRPGARFFVSHEFSCDAEPIDGKLSGIIPKAMQACLERYKRSVDVVKYTSWRVVCTVPSSDEPEIRRGKAPSMSIGFSFAADIFIEHGMRSVFCSPSL